MLPAKLAFVDIETTGGRSMYDRIIEIGILRVENNKIIRTFQSLINPHAYLPKEITMLTGITAGDLENAPTFREIKDEIGELLTGCIFVAHNARFDYSFVKREFGRHTDSFTARQLCTVKLSRLLYPGWSHHNLDSVIEHCNFTCLNRHRAFDDAKVLVEFYHHLQTNFPPDALEKAINTCLKKPSLPIKLKREILDNLPEKPGVYIFYGTVPLYVGKSKNIRERVLSHFAADIRNGVEMQISQQIAHIETITTAGELGALLLESQLIKKLLPLYNRKSRLKREMVAVKSRLTKNGYQEAYLEHVSAIHLQSNSDSWTNARTTCGQARNNINVSGDPSTDGESRINLQSFLGFFESRRQAKATLAELAKKYHLCEKLLGLEKTNSGCFAYRLEQCKGACLGLEKPELYNLRFLMAFTGLKISRWPFQGAIAIEEKGIDGKRQYFLVDQWCYLGNVTIDEDGNRKESLQNEVTFDLDVYTIIKHYLSQSNHQKTIKIMLPWQNKGTSILN